ncbi:MAG: NAD(+) synthase [Chryseobacterium sp.]|nr:MAG: NAD(+) synthase [Chryseobacterium sp.]
MRTKEVIEYIVGWMKDYAEAARMKGFVLGISGGVDSAVVSALAAKTGLDTLLLEMPIRQQSAEVSRAREHIADLESRFPNVRSLSVDLTATFNAFESVVDVSMQDFPARNLAFANSRARLRMLTLYYYGQLNGLLVAGTGNKIEDFGVGFFTKYGDGGVDISPIGDLMKTEVYNLAHGLDIVQSIQNAVPTDGLWDNAQTDEQQLGASYPELEWAMQHYDDHKADDFTGRQREVFAIYDRLHRANLHKINPIPICEIPEKLKNG